MSGPREETIRAANFLIQARKAAELATAQAQRLAAEGFEELVPGEWNREE